MESLFDCRELGFVGGCKHHAVDDEFKSNYGAMVTDLTETEHDRFKILLRDRQIPLIMIYKNPHAWLVSYHRAFVGEGVQLTDDLIYEYMQTYNEMNRHWYEKCDMVIDYHELLTNQLDVMIQVQKEFDLEWLDLMGTTDVEVSYKTRQSSEQPVIEIISNTRFDKTYYAGKVYLEHLSGSQADYITRLNRFYGLSWCP